MSVRPLRDRVLVKRVQAEEKTAGGLFMPASAKEKPQQGEIMAVGRGRMNKDGEFIAMQVSVGDRILFSKYSGSEVKLEGEELLILREDDILGVFEG